MANWIAGAIKHPGALHRQLGVPQGKPIPAGKLSHAASAGGKLGERARLAETLKGMHHRAGGGPVERGRSYVVGEHGPEVMVPRHAGWIVPNQDQGQQGHPRDQLPNSGDFPRQAQTARGPSAGAGPGMPREQGGQIGPPGTQEASEWKASYPGRAFGGPVRGGHPYVVGERGPEIMHSMSLPHVGGGPQSHTAQLNARPGPRPPIPLTGGGGMNVGPMHGPQGESLNPSLRARQSLLKGLR